MIYAFLISFIPLANYFSKNLEKISSLYEIAVIAACTLTLSLFLLFFFKIILRRPKEYAYLPILLTVVFVFHYGSLVEELSFLENSYIKTSFIWFLLYVFLMFGILYISQFKVMQTFTKFFVILLLVFPLLNIVTNLKNISVSGGQTLMPNMKVAEYSFQNKPNIYYILLDAYARQDTLQETLSFDNSAFLEDLEKIGFSVSRQAHSNYHFTVASLSATMNMCYHKKNNGVLEQAKMFESLKGINNVRKIVAQNGYKIINIPSHWHQIGCFGNEDVCISDGKSLEIYQSFLSTTPLRILKFKKPYVNPQQVKDSLKISPMVPKFIFAHFAQVHDSVYNDCSYDGDHAIYSNLENGRNYLLSVQFMNKKMLNLLKEIIECDKSCVIIVQSDHGPCFVGNQPITDPNYWLKHNEEFRIRKSNDKRYTFGVFSAVYCSSNLKNVNLIKKYFSGAFSLVNTFRYIFAWLSGVEPKLLADEMHFLYFDEKNNHYNEVNIDQISN